MKKLSELEQKASSKVLGELRKHTQGLLSGKMKGLKKVTVASDSPEGLKEGLEKAGEILEETEEESSHEEVEGDEPNTEEEIDALITELIAKKAELSKK